jgi:hypothetical protein
MEINNNHLDRYIDNYVIPYWKNPQFTLEYIHSLTILSIVIIINNFAVSAATESARNSQPVRDIILDHIYINTNFIDSHLAIVLSLCILAIIVLIPQKANIYLRGLALVILLRDFFINLTHLGIPSGATPTVSFFTKGGDLFFSGHVALPFLGVLVFWEYTYIRNMFIVISIAMAVETLVGHHHYSIDVFAAPFIVYGVFVFLNQVLLRPSIEGRINSSAL